MSDNVLTSEGLGLQEVPRKVKILANALAKIHGSIVIRREEHGLHLYMASPTGLEKDGSKELQSKHLTVNADRYFGLGQWTNRVGSYNRESSACCHKYGTKFTVSQLKNFPPLEDRGIKDASHQVYNNAVSREKYLIDDGKGNRIPLHPGETIPIQELPMDHPAIEYLLSRDYNIDILAKQFRCAYCYAETPEDPEIKLYYRRLPGDFKDTPQGRLIFYIDVKGVQEGWQARCLEKIEGNEKYYWHPYKNEWELVFVNKDDTWLLREDWHGCPYPWKISKYRTGNGVARSRVVMGYDAASAWNDNVQLRLRTCCLSEGPLDAGRIGPPGLAFLGKYLNAEQGALIAKAFKRVIFIADADASGQESKKSVYRALAGKVELEEVTLPKGVKDLGEMTRGEAWALIKEHLL